MNKTGKKIVQLQPSIPLLIYITVYLRETFTQTYCFARLAFNLNRKKGCSATTKRPQLLPVLSVVLQTHLLVFNKCLFQKLL